MTLATAQIAAPQAAPPARAPLSLTGGQEPGPEPRANGALDRLLQAGRLIRLSRFGWLVLGLSSSAWLAGWLLGWAELLTMAAAGLVLIVLAAPFALGSTSVDTSVDLAKARVVAGERAAGRLVIGNHGGRRLLPFEVRLAVGHSTASFAVASLASGGQQEELIVMPTDRRGVIAVGPATVVRGDPLGLVRRSVAKGEPRLLYVHPRTVPVGPLGQGVLPDPEGVESDDPSSSDLAFAALREYVPGDDRRHIHWKSTARADRLMVRQFADTRRSRVTFLLSSEPRDYCGEDEYELAVSAVGSMAVAGIRADQGIAVLTAGERLPTSSGQRFLDALAGVERRWGGGIDSCAAMLREGGQLTGAVVFITGSAADPSQLRATARRLSGGAAPVLLRIDAQGTPGLRFAGGVPTLTMSRLADLRRLLRAVA